MLVPGGTLLAVQQLTPTYATAIGLLLWAARVVTTEDTLGMVSDRTKFETRFLDWVRVKGRAGATRIYELLGPKSDHWLSDEAARIYDEGLAAYRERDWDVAERRFDEFLALHPEDGPTAVMRERVQMLRAHPPGAEWDGVFEQLSK